MDNRDPIVQIVTDIPDDAAVVRELLEADFDNLTIVSDMDSAAAEFDSALPDVLVMAFNELEKAERYYLTLSKLSAKVIGHSYRTIVLCQAGELHDVFSLCKKGVFDDYVLFWPVGHDVRRLPMAVHHAVAVLRLIAGSTPSNREFATGVRGIAGLDGDVADLCREVEEHAEQAQSRLTAARENLDAEISSLGESLADAGAFGAGVSTAAIDRRMSEFKNTLTDKCFDPIQQGISPIRGLGAAAHERMDEKLDTVRELGSMSARVVPKILFVDDDDFQHRIVEKIFVGPNVDMVFARSGSEALSLMRTDVVDLVLLDVDMPGLGGVETLGHFKAVERLARIPIIMATGRRERDLVLKCIKAGASGYVIKPFDRERLVAKVREFIPLVL